MPSGAKKHRVFKLSNERLCREQSFKEIGFNNPLVYIPTVQTICGDSKVKPGQVMYFKV